MRNRLSGIVVLGLLFIVISLTACDDMSKKVGTRIEKVSILSVSEERPAEVLIGVVGLSHEAWCANRDAKIDANRRGNIIRLSATMEVPTGIVDCVAPITEVYGEVIVENLEAGTYSVVQDDRELLHFHIGTDTSHAYLGPVIESIDVAMKTFDGAEQNGPWVETRLPVDVTVSVRGYFDSQCQSYLDTHIYRAEFGFVVVDISGDVPITNGECALSIDPYQNPITSPYDLYAAEIDLGTFSTGDYKVIVNGESTWFSIKPKNTDEAGQGG